MDLLFLSVIILPVSHHTPDCGSLNVWIWQEVIEEVTLEKSLKGGITPNTTLVISGPPQSSLKGQ